MTKIEWTEKTWNPIVGCSIVSPGCTNCYAMKMAARMQSMINAARSRASSAALAGDFDGDDRPPPPRHYDGTTKVVNGNAVWTGKLARAPENILLAPLRRKTPTMYFVNSMSDLFHEDVPDEWIDHVFAVMALCPQHTFQVLTKRSARMRKYFDHGPRVDIDCAIQQNHDQWNLTCSQSCTAFVRTHEHWPLPNVWLGVSAEDQRRADERIPDLLKTPAAVRFVSMEPLLSFVDMKQWLPAGRPAKSPDGKPFLAPHFFMTKCEHCGWVGSSELCPLLHNWDDADVVCPSCEKIFLCDDYAKIDWVIVGGESGNDARPMHPDWARSIREQCNAAGVAFFFKQWGEYLPVGQVLPGYGKIHGATAVKTGRMKLHYGGTTQQEPMHAFAERGVDFASTADGRLTFRVKKKAAGRLLDDREWNEMPGRAGKAAA